MSTRTILVFMLSLGLTSCKPSFEMDYYERISGMKFPDKIRVIESFDNGEWVTTTSLMVDSSELINFIRKYEFIQMDIIYPSQFIGEHTLKKIKPDFHQLKNLRFKIGSKGKNSWFYVVDLNRRILWAEIQYPDWGGT